MKDERLELTTELEGDKIDVSIELENEDLEIIPQLDENVLDNFIDFESDKLDVGNFSDAVFIKGDKGDKGEKGDTPVKGVDYFTEEDIQGIYSRCIFSSYSAALEAAGKAQNVGSTSAVYFYGMIFAVVDETQKTVKHYSVELDNTLKEIGKGNNTDSSDYIKISQIGKNLEIDKNNKINVKTADNFDGDNTRPITAAATQTIVGNIDVLLKTI